MSDDSMPSFAIIDTDRSKAPFHQLHKLKGQKEQVLSNNPQTNIARRNTLDHYQYDQRLRNLQKQLLSANKADKELRRELEAEKDN